MNVPETKRKVDLEVKCNICQIKKVHCILWKGPNLHVRLIILWLYLWCLQQINPMTYILLSAHLLILPSLMIIWFFLKLSVSAWEEYHSGKTDMVICQYTHPATGNVVFHGGLPVCPLIVPLNARVNRARRLLCCTAVKQQGNHCAGRYPLL